MSRYYPPSTTADSRRAGAAKEAAKQQKKGATLAPVKIVGRTIATTFWGKKWCTHLETFSDFANRLPRGRTYVRTGAVFDLQISPGKIEAQVMGSTRYRQVIAIAPLPPERWEPITQSCAGRVDSVVELLQGRFSTNVMEVLCHPRDGLFPRLPEIKMECSCPDWASLCKHLAAVLYGIGARLDTEPELLFLLRNVDHGELIAEATSAHSFPAADGESGLDPAALSEIFGIDIAPLDLAEPVAEQKPPPQQKPKAAKAVKAKSAKKPPAASTNEPPPRTRPIRRRKPRAHSGS